MVVDNGSNAFVSIFDHITISIVPVFIGCIAPRIKRHFSKFFETLLIRFIRLAIIHYGHLVATVKITEIINVSLQVRLSGFFTDAYQVQNISVKIIARPFTIANKFIVSSVLITPVLIIILPL